MPVNPFSFLAQAISDLLTSNLGLFETMGLGLFRGLAVILLAWFGVKAALSSAQGGPGFNFAKFADLILVEGDPLADINDVSKVQCVMKNGKLMSVAEIMRPFVASTSGDDICPAP